MRGLRPLIRSPYAILGGLSVKGTAIKKQIKQRLQQNEFAAASVLVYQS